MLSISAGAWILVAMEATGMALPAFCSTGALWTAPSASLDLVLALNPPGSLAAGWALMLAAMMAPLLIVPVRHIRDRCLPRGRARVVALFVAGYATSWMVAGAMLLALAIAMRLAVPRAWLPLSAAALPALVWQISPAKQICLNRCHLQPELAAFGLAADVDALHFGLTHGIWCVGSCWALMLLPLLVPHGHVATMAAVALWLFSERLERPTSPRWIWRGPGKAIRIVAARAGMRPRHR
ncbi:copper chaperone [Mesorhizobium montanum]|uniref:copper chaperone n=1 Tax=Mesorhizobium montanum TaxID=3072323 RepID=UPI002A23FD7C|nr:DUF2182 domain-containing protein [Mesorhizobium sp. MSK_1335]